MPAPSRTVPSPEAPATTGPAGEGGCYSSLPSRDPTGPRPAITYLTLEGNAYDEVGTPLDGVTVTLKSLDASVPYRWQVAPTCLDGLWRQLFVPDGLYLEVVASRPGWTPRRRVGRFALQAGSRDRRFVVDFGAPAGSEASTEGAAFFLSDRPELTLVAPAPEAKDVDPSAIVLKLRVSEPLDAAAQRAIADALVLIPADAAPGEPDGYAVHAASTFLGGEPAAVTWNAEGTELTFRLAAPLRTSRDAATRYRVALVAGATPIGDAGGQPLGDDAAGIAADVPGPLVRNAFLADRFPERLSVNADATARWAATHRASAEFALPPDTTPPALLGVTASDAGADAVIALRFSEPMATFDGTSRGWADPSVRGHVTGGGRVDDPGLMRRYSFLLADGPLALDELRLDGWTDHEPIYDPRTDAPPPHGREFALAPPAVRFDGDLAKAAPGEVVIAAGPADPRVVTFTIKGRAGHFVGSGALAARVAGIADPAGNPIAEADGQVARSPL